MKKFLATLLLSTSLATASLADVPNFYNKSQGQWTVVGKPPINSKNPACQIETMWSSNAQFALVNDLSDDEIYIGYFNPTWNIADAPGTQIPFIIELIDGEQTLKVNMFFEVVAPQTIRVRHIKPVFYILFAQSSKMIMHMPGNIPSFTIGLKGTRAAIASLQDCRAAANALGFKAPQALPIPSTKKPGVEL